MNWLRDNRHQLIAYAWVAVTVPAAIWWPDSVLWVIVVSHYANFETSLAAHHANRSRQADKTTDKIDAIGAYLASDQGVVAKARLGAVMAG